MYTCKLIFSLHSFPQERQIKEAGASFIQEDFQELVDQSEQSLPESERVDFSSAFHADKRKEVDDAAFLAGTKRKRRTEGKESGLMIIGNGMEAKAERNMKRTMKVKSRKKVR